MNLLEMFLQVKPSTVRFSTILKRTTELVERRSDKFLQVWEGVLIFLIKGEDSLLIFSAFETDYVMFINFLTNLKILRVNFCIFIITLSKVKLEV